LGNIHLVDDIIFLDLHRREKRSEPFPQPLASHFESLPSPSRCNRPLRGSGDRKGQSACHDWVPHSAGHCEESPSCTPCVGSTFSPLPSPGRRGWCGHQTSSTERPRSPAACSDAFGQC